MVKKPIDSQRMVGMGTIITTILVLGFPPASDSAIISVS